MKRKILVALLALSVAGVGLRLWQLARQSEPRPVREVPRRTGPIRAPAPAPAAASPKVDHTHVRASRTVAAGRDVPDLAPDVAARVEELADATSVLLDEQKARAERGEYDAVEYARAVQLVLDDYRTRWMTLTGRPPEALDAAGR